jgi:hypothetical protein
LNFRDSRELKNSRISIKIHTFLLTLGTAHARSLCSISRADFKASEILKIQSCLRVVGNHAAAEPNSRRGARMLSGRTELFIWKPSSSFKKQRGWRTHFVGGGAEARVYYLAPFGMLRPDLDSQLLSRPHLVRENPRVVCVRA